MSSRPNRPAAILQGLFPLVVAAGVLFVLVVVGGKAVQGYEMRQEARAVERRIEELKRENRRMAQELEYYLSDEYIEKLAREELGLVRPGDVAVVIVPSDSRTSPPSMQIPTPVPTATPATREIPTWQRWMSLFVGPD